MLMMLPAQYPYDPPTPGGAPTVQISVAHPSRKAARKRGIRVTVTCNVACQSVVRAYKGPTTYAQKLKTLPTGTGKVRLKLSAAAKRKLKSGKAFRFSISAAARDSSGADSNIATKTVVFKKKTVKKKHK
jgi:hypothetical protein